MFARLVILVVSSMSFLHRFHVSGCDTNCADKPVFTPSSLVVKFGDPTSANCSVCEHACVKNKYGVESPAGVTRKDGTTISWTVDSLTEWSVSSLCFYSDDAGHQCCTFLPVTVYQPPQKVSISFVNLTGPMLEGRQYTLQCTVEHVAPVKDLRVTFYRGQTALGQPQSNNTTVEKPVIQIFSVDISPGREEDGAQYWCEAKLELGPEGPKLPPVETSQNITATVHYQPHLEGSSHPDTIRVREGELLRLNCSAVANPPPTYTWTYPSGRREASHADVLTINSTTVSDGGKFTCSVVNLLGNVTKEFDVELQANPTGIIIAVVVAVVLVIVASGLVAYYCYRQNRWGQYNLKEVFSRSHMRHSAVPTAN
uniref:hemicentin-1-like isoform X1 n=1 Tax=Gasterosteus aculeatus aculeatus TaxID=481459 RepID=UPI001A9969D0|nr:hemicentin-1-like isoform X1 [Gasterosteus aculeatus aculeatus]